MNLLLAGTSGLFFFWPIYFFKQIFILTALNKSLYFIDIFYITLYIIDIILQLESV